jgi:hypothetical protein
MKTYNTIRYTTFILYFISLETLAKDKNVARYSMNAKTLLPHFDIYTFSIQRPCNYIIYLDIICGKIPETPDSITIVNMFTIHGLWPSLKDGKPVERCLQEILDINFTIKNKKLLGKMNKYWPSFTFKTNNNKFWKHELIKRGYCFSQDLTYIDPYFAKAIGLYEKYKLNFLLRDLLKLWKLDRENKNLCCFTTRD